MEETVKEFMMVVLNLTGDVLLCVTLHEQVEENKKQPLRRAVVRSVFAMIEGSIYRMKQIALEANSPEKQLFSQGEVDMLAEVTYRLAENGVVKKVPAKISLDGNILFAFKAIERVTKTGYTLEQGADWELLKRSIRLRDRLTHPKTLDQLVVTDQDYGMVLTAWGWFGRQVEGAFGRGPGYPWLVPSQDA